ncbi:MAG: hypothetical protein Q9163_003186 [Psora crenata]
MPHVFKDIDPADLQLLDRSPVQTPLHTASNTPTTSTSSTPTISPKVKATTNLATRVPIAISLLSPTGTPVVRPSTPVDEHDFRRTEFKGKDAERVSHLDRSPVQTAFQTRASSQQGRAPRMHGWEEAEEMVGVLRKMVEDGSTYSYTNGCDAANEDLLQRGGEENIEPDRVGKGESQ